MLFPRTPELNPSTRRHRMVKLGFTSRTERQDYQMDEEILADCDLQIKWNMCQGLVQLALKFA